MLIPVADPFGHDAEADRAPWSIGRRLVEDHPFETSAGTNPIQTTHTSAEGTLLKEQPRGGDHQDRDSDEDGGSCVSHGSDKSGSLDA